MISLVELFLYPDEHEVPEEARAKHRSKRSALTYHNKVKVRKITTKIMTLNSRLNSVDLGQVNGWNVSAIVKIRRIPNERFSQTFYAKDC